MLLSSSPCCAGDECCNECSENSATKPHPEKPSNTCSPFMVCGSCTGFVIVAVNHDLNSETVITLDLKGSYIHVYLDYYYSKFWQPPKLS